MHFPAYYDRCTPTVLMQLLRSRLSLYPQHPPPACPCCACQVASWPLQPQDAAIAWVKGLPKGAVVADFGCGDARLAASVPQVELGDLG